MAMRNTISRLFSATSAAVSKPLPFGLKKGAAMDPQLQQFTVQSGQGQVGHFAAITRNKEKAVWSAFSNKKWSWRKTLTVYMLVGGPCAYQNRRMYDQLLQQGFAICKSEEGLLRASKDLKGDDSRVQCLKEEEQKRTREYMAFCHLFQTCKENAEPDQTKIMQLLFSIDGALKYDEIFREMEKKAWEMLEFVEK